MKENVLVVGGKWRMEDLYLNEKEKGFLQN